MNKSNYASTREPTDTHQQILDDEISTLPSPSMSNVGIDSDQDTTETEVLLSSYLKKAGGIYKQMHFLLKGTWGSKWDSFFPSV